MPLAIVSDIVANGGYLPQLAELEKVQKSIWTKKNGVMFSIFWFIFWVPFMAAVFGGVFEVEVMGALCALVGVMGSLLIFIFSLAYLKRTPKRPIAMPTLPQASHAGLYGQAGAALPPQPASDYARPSAGSWRDTGDFAPQTVTEGTTQLLTEEKELPGHRRCPTCSTDYTDRSLRFCLVDGAPLADEPDKETVARSTNELSEPQVTRSGKPQ